MKIKRSELYDKVWSTPMVKLAQEFGLSNVALAKACKSYNIPRPPRGYWARIAAGHTPPIIELPEGEEIEINFDLESNKIRRNKFKQETQKHSEIIESLKYLKNKDTHPLAITVQSAFNKSKVDKNGLVHIRKKTTPLIIASPALEARIVEFISSFSYSAEENNILIRPGKLSRSIEFRFKNDILNLHIEEPTEEYELEPTLEQKRKPSWEWDNKRLRPCGKLSFKLTSPQGVWGRCKWSESESTNAMDLMPKVFARMETLFEGFELKRIKEKQDAEERKLRDQRWAEEEKARDHRDKISKIKNNRIQNLLHAAWSLRAYEDINHFINSYKEKCLQKNGQFSSEQENWIKWARNISEEFNPLNQAYPNPIDDSFLTLDSIPIGGPYPEIRNIRKPPQIDELKRLMEARSTYGRHAW